MEPAGQRIRRGSLRVGGWIVIRREELVFNLSLVRRAGASPSTTESSGHTEQTISFGRDDPPIRKTNVVGEAWSECSTRAAARFVGRTPDPLFYSRGSKT